MATQISAIREYGPPPGAPGIKVREVPGIAPLADANYGAAFFMGVLKRGPEGVAVPVSSRREYNQLFGDPNDDRWHLFPDGSHQTPDAIDGYFRTAAGRGTLSDTGASPAATGFFRFFPPRDPRRRRRARRGGDP